jgi:hypothetical protein
MKTSNCTEINVGIDTSQTLLGSYVRKPKNMATVALLRKQLIILNTMMKNGTQWNANMR